MTTRSRSRVEWLASRDGVAHAHRPGEPQTACGVSRVPQRWAWPTVRECADCLRVLGRLPLQDGAR